MLLSKALDNFLVRCQAEGLSVATVTFYNRQIGYYQKWLNSQPDPPNWLEIQTLRAYLAWLQARVKKEEIEPETVDAAYRALRALCNWLAREEQISSTPFAKIKQPKVPDKVPKQVTIDDYKKLLLSIKINRWLDVRDRFIIIVLFWCGLRVEELINLNLDDIDMQHNLIRVRAGKGGDPRFTPMLPLVKQSFLDYLYHRPNVDTRALFPACNGNYALNNGIGDSGVRIMLARRCREAGIERKNPHAFRHGIAMHLLNELGADMSFIAELLGHKDEKTTKRFYAQWKTAGLAKKYAKLLQDQQQSE